MIIAGLHALAVAGPRHRRPWRRWSTWSPRTSGCDGVWPNADLFATLEALLAADLPAARQVIGRAVPALLERQRADGAFGATAQQERALIALRALHLTERPAAPRG